MSCVAEPSSAPPRRDGDRITGPGGTWIPCARCGSRLNFLTWWHGEALCRYCLGDLVARGVGP